MNDIRKISIKRSITNSYATYKIEIPHEYLQQLELLGTDNFINIEYKDKKLILTKATKKLFKSLSVDEKTAQIHKYMQVHGTGCGSRGMKDVIKEMSEYFSISERTVYRKVNEEVKADILAKTELLDEQSDDSRNIKVFFSKRHVHGKYDYVIGRAAITPTFAAAFITGQNINHINDMDGAFYKPELSTFQTIAQVSEIDGVKRIVLRNPLKVTRVDEIYKCEMPREYMSEIGITKDNTDINIKLTNGSLEVGKPVEKLRKNAKSYNEQYNYSEEVLPIKPEYAAALKSKKSDIEAAGNDDFSVIIETKENNLVIKSI